MPAEVVVLVVVFRDQKAGFCLPARLGGFHRREAARSRIRGQKDEAG
jgi:hypothetical protein